MSRDNIPTKAVFLDRDGTILKEIITGNQDETLGYLTEVSDVELIENSAQAISQARKLGYLIIIISNQSAIARGWLTEEKLKLINEEMYKQLKESDPEALVDDFFYSPYHIEGVIEKYKKESPTRKPGIGLVLEAKEKYNINLTESYFIGDSYSDMKCAENAGINRILVSTGYGKQAYKNCLDEGIKINFIAKNLYNAVKYIKEHEC